MVSIYNKIVIIKETYTFPELFSQKIAMPCYYLLVRQVLCLLCVVLCCVYFCLRPVSRVPNVASVQIGHSLCWVVFIFVFVMCLVCLMLPVSTLFILCVLLCCVYFCLHPVSRVPNVASVQIVYSLCCVVFIFVFIMCLVCLKLPVSTLFILCVVLSLFLSSSCVSCA